MKYAFIKTQAARFPMNVPVPSHKSQSERLLRLESPGKDNPIPPQEMALRRYLKALYDELSPDNPATGICVQKALSSVVIAYGDSWSRWGKTPTETEIQGDDAQQSSSSGCR